MFNYSLTSPYYTGAGTGMFGQYTIPYDYMNGCPTNNNLFNFSNAFMNPYYNCFNPNFMGMNNGSSKTSKSDKNKKLEYTPMYASDEIYKTSQAKSEKDKINDNLGKAAAIAAGVVAVAFVGSALVNGKANFNGTTGQYIKSLFTDCGNGIKNFFENCADVLKNAFSKDSKLVLGASNLWEKVSGLTKNTASKIASGGKNVWSSVSQFACKLFTRS